jgi:hypothetical protein
VKKKVIVKTAHVQPGKNQQAKKEITESFFHLQINPFGKTRAEQWTQPLYVLAHELLKVTLSYVCSGFLLEFIPVKIGAGTTS